MFLDSMCAWGGRLEVLSPLSEGAETEKVRVIRDNGEGVSDLYID